MKLKTQKFKRHIQSVQQELVFTDEYTLLSVAKEIFPRIAH